MGNEAIVTTELDDFATEDAALEAAMLAENLADGMKAETVEGDEPEADKPAEVAVEPAPKEQEAEPPAKEPDPVEPVKVSGVLAKDGVTVLPYGALKGARQEARLYRERANRAEQELADLKAGKTPEASESERLTDAEVEELAADFPQLAKLAKVVARASQAAPAAQAPTEPDESDPLQDAIDSVPLLAEWQAADSDKWERAKALDRALEGSPKWKDKPITARFAHVAGLISAEYDIQTPVATAPSAAPTHRKPPEQVIGAAARNAPNTLSDFKGGAPDASRDSIDRLPPVQQMNRMEKMSDSEIEAYLRKVGG